VLVIIAASYIKEKNREKQTFLAQVEKMQNSPIVLEKESPTPTPEAPLTANAPKPETIPDATMTPSAAGSQTSESTAKTSKSSASLMATASIEDEGGGRPSETSSISSPAATENHEATSASEGKSGAVKGELRVRALYAEVSAATLERWSLRMQAMGQFSQTDFRMGLLPNIEAEMASDPSIVILEKVEKKFKPQGSVQEWSVGHGNKDQFTGLKTVHMGLYPTEMGGVRGEIKITRHIESTDPRSFEAGFEAPPKAGWVFADILPHQYRLEPEDELSPKSIFKIFTSTRFKNLTTQFTLLFVFDRN